MFLRRTNFALYLLPHPNAMVIANRRVARLCVLGVLACARPDTESATPGADSVTPATTTTTSNPGPAAASQEIFIDSVRPGNPITVTGRARTFENTVQVRVRDAAGRLIAQTHTTSDGEMGHHNPYSAQLWLVRDPGDRLIAEAFEYSAMDGSERSLTSDTLPHTSAKTRITLLFPGSDCTQTVAFTRDVPKPAAIARLLVQALIAGPDSVEAAAGATSAFPAGSRVNNVVLRGGDLTVDFNERLQNVGGACAAQGIRASVTRTLERLPTVKRVIITAGGSEPLALQP